MIFISAVLAPVLRKLPEGSRRDLFRQLGPPMRVLAWASLLILLLTGTLSLWHGGIAWEGSAGRLLIAKLFLAGTAAVLSAVHDFLLGTGRNSRKGKGFDPTPPSGKMVNRLVWLARLNLLLALGIVLLAVLMVRS